MLHLENLIINKHTQNNSDKLIFLGGYIGASPIQNLINKFPKDNSIK